MIRGEDGESTPKSRVPGGLPRPSSGTATREVAHAPDSVPSGDAVIRGSRFGPLSWLRHPARPAASASSRSLTISSVFDFCAGRQLQAHVERFLDFEAGDPLHARPGAAAEDLPQDWRDEVDDLDPLVFMTPRGHALSRTLFRARPWARAVGAAGITPPPNFHDLRHTAVTMAIAAGAYAKEIAELVGHASIKTTMDVYGHMMPSRTAELAATLEEVRQRAGARMRHAEPTKVISSSERAAR
jgi:hypothetical protein